MWKKVIYLFLCVIFLSGCERVAKTETESTIINESESNTNGVEEEDNELKEEASKEEETSVLDQQSESIETEGNIMEDTSIEKKYNLPEGFVYVDDVIPTVELDIRYYTDYNFVGEKIDGYQAPLAILTTQAAGSLKKAADKLEEDGYHIKIYDAYRPQKAVEHFVRWSQLEDDSMKEIFYPSMEKAILFTDGYISKTSRHSRGSTIDLTIADENGQEIDMGGYFDLLDTISNYDTDEITEKQHENREYLRNIMEEAGFDSIRTEWWHFQLKEEPYKDTYFDFDIE